MVLWRDDAKARELIAVAVSLSRDGCVHTAEARSTAQPGEEIAEALGVAISVNAGAALVYSARTLDAFAAAKEA